MGTKKDNDQDYAANVLRLAIIFGAKCEVCGVSEPSEFEYHHDKGGGTSERREAGGLAARKMLRKCVENGRPKDGVSLLCTDCHAKVHRIERKEVWGRLVTEDRTKAILGDISENDLRQLVADEKIVAEVREPKPGRREYFFSITAILNYVRSDATLLSEIGKRILASKPNEVKVNAGKRGHEERERLRHARQANVQSDQDPAVESRRRGRR